jgi:hypothetical protein
LESNDIRLLMVSQQSGIEPVYDPAAVGETEVRVGACVASIARPHGGAFTLAPTWILGAAVLPIYILVAVEHVMPVAGKQNRPGVNRAGMSDLIVALRSYATAMRRLRQPARPSCPLQPPCRFDTKLESQNRLSENLADSARNALAGEKSLPWPRRCAV